MRPVLALALLAVGCFSESNTYDDCAQVGCESGEESSGTTNVGETTALPTSSTTGADSSDAESTSPSSDGSTETSTSESSSSGGPLPVCGDGVPEPPEQCDDADDTDPHDGCFACQITPQLEFTHVEDYADDGYPDAVLSLAFAGENLLASAVVGSADTFDDAAWFRIGIADAFVDPRWGLHAILPEYNRVLSLAKNGMHCALGGYVNGWNGSSIAAGNVIDCDTGMITHDMMTGAGEQEGGEEIRGVVVRGDGTIVAGGKRMHDGVLRGWISELSIDGMTVDSTTWLDDPFFADASEVNGLGLAPADDTVFVAGSFHDAGVAHGFAAPLPLVHTMPAPFGASENESVALDVRPLPTGMAVAGWSISNAGDSDARVELFPMGGGDPTVWTLGDAGEDRFHGLVDTPDGIVAAGYTSALATGQDVLVVWLDTALAEQHRAVWDSGDANDDLAWDIVTTGEGVAIGGAAGPELLVQHWTLPSP